MKGIFKVVGLLVSFTTPVLAGTKVYEEKSPVTPFSLCVFAEPEKMLGENPKAKLRGRDKAITNSAKDARKYARKQYSKWFALADSPAHAEIVLNIKDRTHEKRKKEIRIEGTVKILDLYDGPISSSYTYSDTGSPAGSEKWKDGAKQLVVYLKHICEHNLGILEEHREFFHAVRTGESENVREMWRHILDVEDRILISHNRLINLARQKAITDSDIAEDLQREVLQPWQEKIKLVSQMSVHESQKELHSSIMSYMKLREEGWSLLVSAFRDGDDEKLITANKKQKDAQEARVLIQNMQRTAQGFNMWF